MINSLLKDSHTQPALATLAQKNDAKGPVVKYDVPQKFYSGSTHDKVSFCGISAARLANTESIKKVWDVASTFLKEKGQKVNAKSISALVSEVAKKAVKADELEVIKVDSFADKLNGNAAEFAKKYSTSLDEYFEEAAEFIKDTKFSKDVLKRTGDAYSLEKDGFKITKSYKRTNVEAEDAVKFSNEFANSITKDVRVSLETLPTVKKCSGGKSFYTNRALHKFLDSANDNSAVFSALAAAVFACALRPVTIMAMPAKGKNKEDNKYSASHSISSGLVGAAIAFAINLPISLALMNFAKNPLKFTNKVKNLKFSDSHFGNYKLDFEKMLSDKNYDDGAKVINLGTEVLLAIPQALLTTALIPPILKKMGIQKSSQKAKEIKLDEEKNEQQQTEQKSKSKEVSFKGNGKSILDPLSSLFANVFNSEKFGNLVNALNGKSGSSTSIAQKLSTAKSALITGLYVTRTVQNKDLDPDRRTTLGINQFGVWSVATVLSLTFDKVMNKFIDKFTDNFRAANVMKMIDAAGNDENAMKKVSKNLDRFTGGIKTAKSLIIVSLVYRYLSPVLVTPVANHIGNWVEAKKKGKTSMPASSNVVK